MMYINLVVFKVIWVILCTCLMAVTQKTAGHRADSVKIGIRMVLVGHVSGDLTFYCPR